MKTLLVMSTSGDKSIPQTKWQQPLGLAYIAACVRDISDVSIIDCEVEDNYTKRLMDEINTDDQLVVGFSVNTYTYPRALELARIVKNIKPEAHISFGGYHATPLATQIITNRPFVDSVIRGDGELPFRQLVTALSHNSDLSGVGSLTYRKDGHVFSNLDAPLPDLDSLAYPARDLLQLDKCFDNFKKTLIHKIYGISRILFVSANRGCPNECNFCSIFNKRFRKREPSKIVDEFEHLIDIYKADSIYLVGDNLNLNKKMLLELCNNIITRGLNIKWICVTLEPMSIDREIADKMRHSGCVRATFGFESGSQEMLDSLNKKVSLDKAKKSIEILNRSGIDIVATFILGSPGESEKTLEDTINFIKLSKFKACSASILAPLPGSNIFKKLINKYADYDKLDIIPLYNLQDIYINDFCYVDRIKLENIKNKIADMFRENWDLY